MGRGRCIKETGCEIGMTETDQGVKEGEIRIRIQGMLRGGKVEEKEESGNGSSWTGLHKLKIKETEQGTGTG